MNRYYVANSSYFDSHPYSKAKIAKAVKAGGGTNVRESNAFGWSNQPKVVTFNATPSTLRAIDKSVQKTIGTSYIIIRKKDW